MGIEELQPNSIVPLFNEPVQIVANADKCGAKPPQAVMLGHLSHERNREKLAIGMVEEVFDRQHRDVDFNLYAAPLYEPSKTIRID